jgi:hypothetical protein
MRALDQEPTSVISLESQAVQSWAGLLYRPVDGVERRGDLTTLPWHPGAWGPADVWLVAKGTEEKAYRPLRIPDLHRRFAKLGRGDLLSFSKRVAHFAKHYGFLGADEEAVPLMRRREFLPVGGLPDGSSVIEAHGEPLRLWREEAHQCAALLDFWNLVQMNDRGEIAKYIQLQPGVPERFEIYMAWRNGALSTHRGFAADWRTMTFEGLGPIKAQSDPVVSSDDVYLWGILTPEGKRTPGVVAVARLFLYRQINLKLRGRVSPVLRPERPAETALLFHPHSLLGAIYLSFAREMSGRQAPGAPCGNPRCLNLLPTDHRRRQYCSDGCRVEAWRDRERGAASTKTPTPISTPIPANDDG